MKLLKVWALAFLLVISFSCQEETKNTADTDNGDTLTETVVPGAPPAGAEQPTFRDATLNGAEVKYDEKNNRVFVIVSGTFSRPCEHIADFKQERNGNNIKIHLSTMIPPGVGCPELEIPMHHSVEVDTKDLAPGTYNLEINGQKTTFVKK